MANAREQFLAERRTAICSSDAPSLFDLPPYGCRRKLWYDKTGAVPDFPFEGNNHTRRGNALEPIIAKEYAAETGLPVKRVPFMRHPEIACMGAHLDRVIHSHDNGRGVLEIKAPTVREYLRTKRSGPKDDYAVQVQHQFAVSGLTWGILRVHSAELWEAVSIPMAADPKMVRSLEIASDKFWRLVENGPAPERLPPGSVQCGKCPFRTQCHGFNVVETPEAFDGEIESDESLADLVRDCLDAAALEDEVKEVHEALRERLKDTLGDRPGATCSLAKIQYRPHEQSTIDTKRLKAEQPELAARYTRKSAVRPLRVIPVKG